MLMMVSASLEVWEMVIVSLGLPDSNRRGCREDAMRVRRCPFQRVELGSLLPSSLVPIALVNSETHLEGQPRRYFVLTILVSSSINSTV